MIFDPLTVYLLSFVPVCLLCGLFARMDGGGKPDTPELVERLLCMSPFLVAAYFINPWLVPVALLGIFGIATGHGQYFMQMMIKAIKPERFDFIVKIFYGNDPRTLPDFGDLTEFAQGCRVNNYGRRRLLRRCVFGMFVTGSIVGLPLAIGCLALGHYIEAALFACTGLVKAYVYYITRPNTVPAEWINGILRTALALAAMGVSLFIAA